MKKTRKTKKHLLIDTYCEGGYSYQDYLEWCEEMDETPAPEGSDAYWDWIDNQKKNDWDDLMANIGCGKNNGRCLLTGAVGRWDGRHTVYPKAFDTLTDAIKAVAADADDVQVWEDGGHVTVHGLHHDGTNIFEIRPLNPRRVGDRSNSEIEEHDNPSWFCGRYPEYLF